MDATLRTIDELTQEYIMLNKRIMNDPLQPQHERNLAKKKVADYINAVMELYK